MSASDNLLLITLCRSSCEPTDIAPDEGLDWFSVHGTVPEFWLNHLDPETGASVADSGYGNKCKVEIISRTDLLRARGYKV